jgi:hypothetical protein
MRKEPLMSADRYEREYHLTPNGWVLGTFYFYGKAKEKVAPPSDRVLTIVKEVEQSCGFSSEEISWREEWRSKKIEASQIARLLKKFGVHPSHVE